MIDIFIGAIILSIWFVILFFEKAIGLSMLLFIVPLTYYLIHILDKNKKIENPKAKILIIPITLLASTYFIFNNTFFNTINRLIIPVLLGIMTLGLFGEKFGLNANLISKIITIFFEPIAYIGETFAKLRNTLKGKLKINIQAKKQQKIKRVIKSIFITIPVVLVIIMLLSSADEIFKNIFVELLRNTLLTIGNIKVSKIIIQIILIICTFGYMLCLFDFLISKYEKKTLEEKVQKTKDNFTIKMILTSLNIVYFVFCYIQIKSLFIRNIDINYAQYARQGFFQLMIVSVINLITILIAKKSENIEQQKSNKYINIMSLMMIGFTFIILISAAVRMYFYESAYGYTLLRLLVYCALFTEALLLIPTILYVIDKRINLAKAYFTIIIVIYVCMNFANFDNIIAKRNVDRYIETGKIDMYYLKNNTGTDAVKQIIRVLEADIDEQDRKEQVREYLKSIYDRLERKSFDIRECNISEIMAKSLIVQLENHTNDEIHTEEKYEYCEEIVISENTVKEFSQEEKVISTQEGGKFVKLGDIAISANDFDEYLYIFNVKENTHKKLYHAEDGIEKIYFDGEYIYLLPSYYRGKGITKIDLLGNAHKIYEGSSLQLWIENDKIYFVDQIGYDQINGTPQGNLCTMKKDGSNKHIIIQNVKHYFKIRDNYIYYTDQNSRSIYKSTLDGTVKTEIAKGRTYITSVTDKFLTYIDYNDEEKHKIVFLDNNQINTIGRFCNVYSSKQGTYLYQRPSLGNDSTLFLVDIPNKSHYVCWSNTENSFEYLAYIYNNYCYLRRGSEFYKVNINNKNDQEKMQFGSGTCFVNGKAYSVKFVDGNVQELVVYDLNN